MRRLFNTEALTGPKGPTLSAKALLFVGVLLLGTAVVAPFYLSRAEQTPEGGRVWRLITTHDLPNFVPMMEQFDKVLRSGVVYPRWNPDFNLGYGTATANFYPPGTFYVTSLINTLTNNWVITLFILSALGLSASCLSFYALARTFYSRPASIVAALLYTLLPYHQLDLYWRGAIPEFLGFALLPLILYFAFKLGSEGRLRHYAGLGLCHGVYLMIHLPVGYLFTYTLAFYAVLWAIKTRDLRIALRIAGGMAISMLVSAIYWLPAALEGKYIYEWASEIFPYHESYITMLPVLGAFDKHVQEVFDYNALALIAAIVILFALSKSSAPSEPATDKDARSALSQTQTKLWIILGILTPFMSTSFSIHLSKLIPKIQIAVPPFRWLAISCMFTSLLVAAAIDLLRKRHVFRPGRKLAYQVALAGVIVLNLWLTVHGIIFGAFSKPTYSPPVNFIESGFTPKDATRPPDMPNTAAVVITPEGGASEVLRWLPTRREIAVRVDQPSQLRLKTYNFPGWTARIDGNVVPMLSDQDGAQQIAVPPGIHNVQATFENTPPRTAGAALSAVGLLLVLGLTLVDRLRQRGLESENQNEERALVGVDAEQTEGLTISGSVPPITSQLKRYGAVGLVVLAGAAIIVITISRSDIGDGGKLGIAGTKDDAASSHPVGGSVGAGSNAQLYLAGKDTIAVAVDQNASGELLAAISGKNEAALEALVESGKVLKVSNNTRVQVLETTAGQTKVRILEGANVMREGWVPERWLR